MDHSTSAFGCCHIFSNVKRFWGLNIFNTQVKLKLWQVSNKRQPV